jgi:hypothetical protein
MDAVAGMAGQLDSGADGRRERVRRAAWLAVFAVAMGFLEAAVVVYLRELYYPEGFRFPVVIIPDRIAIVELIREATTLCMLLGVAAVAARDRHDGFFVFGYVFGMWDIVYYVGLWTFLDWPSSPMEWDILFLIPVPWLGPVAYPVAVSCLLLGGFVVHEILAARGRSLRLTAREWALATAGAAVVVVSFCWHWRAVPEGRVPGEFPLSVFLAGVVVGTLPFLRGIFRAVRR